MEEPANDGAGRKSSMRGNANGVALGEWIRRTRFSQGVNQRALADKAGLSRSYICEIEHGRGSQPSVSTLDKLANALGATRADLLRVAGILETTGRPSSENERRLLAVYRDLGQESQDAIERFARFLHAEELRWVQPALIERDHDGEESEAPVQTGPTLFDDL